MQDPIPPGDGDKYNRSVTREDPMSSAPIASSDLSRYLVILLTFAVVTVALRGIGLALESVYLHDPATQTVAVAQNR